MTPEESVHRMMSRLRQVNWERTGVHAWSRRDLLREYFRRAARWADACRSSSYTPFFDIAECVDPGVRADRELVEPFVQEMRKAGATWDAGQVIPFVLHWAALRAAPDVTLPGLEDPFEPLLLMFERGGGFHMEQGGVNLEWLTVPAGGWRNLADSPPMTTFDRDVLDRVDLEGSMDQFGLPPEEL